MVDGERQEPTGAFVEDVLQSCLYRLRWYQGESIDPRYPPGNDGRFRCRENALAITALEDVLHRLHDRTRNRELRHVEGTHQA